MDEIKLEQYGFEETERGEKYVEYYGHGITVIIYRYDYTQGNGTTSRKETFTVSTKRFSSGVMQLSELGKWLDEKGIKKSGS